MQMASALWTMACRNLRAPGRGALVVNAISLQAVSDLIVAPGQWCVPRAGCIQDLRLSLHRKMYS